MEIASIISGKALTTSLAIAEGTNNQHKNVLELINKYSENLERVGGTVAFETEAFKTTRGTKTRVVAYLNERQATLLLNLMRNNDITVAFKERLTEAFYELAEMKPLIDLDDPVFMAEMWQKTTERLQQTNSENRALRLENQDLRPGAVFAAEVAKAPDAISAGDAAKLIGTGRNRLLAFMRRIKWISHYNAPYQEKIEEGLLDVKLGGFQRPDKGIGQSVTPIVTGKGLIELHRLWSEDQAASAEYAHQLNVPLSPTEH